MINFIPIAALLLALCAGYIAVRAEHRYVLRFVLIGLVAGFGISFYFVYPKVLGRPDPNYPAVDFHMIAMMEEPDHYISMWVDTNDGSRLYRFRANQPLLQKLRSMTDGKGQGIYYLTGHFEKGGTTGDRIPQLDVKTPVAPPLPPKNTNSGAPKAVGAVSRQLPPGTAERAALSSDRAVCAADEPG